MGYILQVLRRVLGNKEANKDNLPKRNADKVLTYRSGITCIVCEAQSIEITEQGLCEICGNVIV